MKSKIIPLVIKPYYDSLMKLLSQSKLRQAEAELYSLPVNIYDHLCIYANQEKRFDELFEVIEKKNKKESKYFLAKRKELEEKQGIRYQFEKTVNLKYAPFLYDQSYQEYFV